MTGPSGVPCRICGSFATVEVGRVEYLAGFNWVVSDCRNCGCRFTPHDAAVHQQLHASPAISYYQEYRDVAERCLRSFEQRDLDRLKRELGRWSKYRFVIDEVSRAPRSARLLEVGCSRGYLASCFILEGRPILGVDVSADAVRAAREAFGDHFALEGSEAVEAGRPYDLIYHVGTIGCVRDPVDVTTRLLAMLKPGGKLLFNAPNRGALHLPGQLWFDSAPPPDLVTLFPQGFWSKQFGNRAVVRERVEMLPADAAFAVGLRRLFRRRWTPPSAKPVTGRAQEWGAPDSRAWELVSRPMLKAARVAGVTSLAPSRPAEFGLFVEISI